SKIEQDPEKLLQRLQDDLWQTTRGMTAEKDQRAAQKGFIDDVIYPRNTRRRLCRALRLLEDKHLENPWKKHDNIPL
ncbi:MAG: hypothetical protein HOJ90_00320, partial [Alphaproteobacteria bacterium]|nr:hypothetical protein [Alphaproteobacteria bacterium]